jgi:dipeptidyl-peptidase-4
MFTRKLAKPALLSICILLVLSSNIVPQKKKFTYDQVFKFRGSGIYKQLPNIKKWIDEVNYLEYKSIDSSKNRTFVKVNVETGEESIFIDYEKWNDSMPKGFNISRAEDNTEDFKKYLFLKDNDLFYLSIDDDVFKQLTNDGIEKKNPTLSPNGKLVAYTKARDLYVFDVDKELETRLTHDASDVIYNGYASWVYYEEILGRASRYKAFWWSPDNNKIAYLRFDDTPVPEYMLYNPDGTHGEWESERYPKAGDPLPYVKFGITDINSGVTTWSNFEDEADHMIAWTNWLPDGKSVIVQWIPRSFDNIKFYSVNATTGEKQEIYNEKQTSWVDWFEDLYIMKDASGFIVRSDKDGWRHLYLYDMAGNLQTQLTSGEWSVENITRVDETNKIIFFHGNKGESTERQFFSVNLDGSNFRQITSEHGTHKCDPSPGGKYITDQFSSIVSPTTLNLLDENGNLVKVLGDSESDELEKYQLGKTELFRVTTSDGYALPVKWVLPADFNMNGKYPVIFSVYGGPGSASVSNSWSRFLSPHYFAQEGIIYAQMDNRGSGHFGKKGESELHRNLGKVEIDDFIEVAKWVGNQPFIDSNKIAITGASYGGYAALMAITRGAGIFDYAIAELSVTDWRLYDNVYTERFMDKPDENPEGYEFGAVVTHADEYKGYALIIHGLLDDNVHPQNSLQVIGKFQDLDKDFEVMFYPNARHGIGFPKFFHNTREKMQFWFKYLLNRDLDIEKD